MTTVVEIPDKLVPVFEPERGELRYRGAYGGRGSGKSFNFATMAGLWGAQEKLRILCTREFQNSIKESFYAELKSAISSHPWLYALYDIGENYIKGINGTEFIFKGLRHNMSSIKSMAQVDICIVEEAESVPESSWRELPQTIRKPKSEIWVIWNPKKEGSPVDKRFKQRTPARSMIVELNYTDNPWFTAELEEERLNDIDIYDLNTYRHIWEGAYLKASEAQILADKVSIREFKPKPGTWYGPYQGLDWGFSQDPTAFVRVWVHDNRLYIEYEAGKKNLDLDDTQTYIERRVPELIKYMTKADSARPESISHVKRKGWKQVRAAKKWPGSVEDGIAHLRSYKEIVIHPRCKETAKECDLYQYKLDKLTGEPTTAIIDLNNHYIDAVRYALCGIIRRKGEKRIRQL